MTSAPVHTRPHSPAVAARYGTTTTHACGAGEAWLPEDQWTEVLHTQLAHRSVRAFTDVEVDDQTLATILTAAQSAPTSSNLQAWSVVVVRDRDRLARLAHAAGDQQFIAEAPVFLVWVADYARLGQIASNLGRWIDGVEFADSVLLAVIDTALAAQNATLAAESLGLGTVFVGGIRNNPEAIRAELGLPERVFAVFGTAIGHPDPARPARVKPRLPQQAVVHTETYQPDSQLPAVAEYQERIGSFYRREGLAHSWTDRVTSRLADAAALKGRDRLAVALAASGLRLG